MRRGCILSQKERLWGEWPLEMAKQLPLNRFRSLDVANIKRDKPVRKYRPRSKGDEISFSNVRV